MNHYSLSTILNLLILTFVCCEKEPINTNGVYAPRSVEDSFPAPSIICGQTYEQHYLSFSSQLGEFPFLALLGYRNSNGTLTYGDCSGVLINKRYVLTAAYCVVGKMIKTVGALKKVFLGAYDKRTKRVCIQIYSVLIDCADANQEINVEISIAHPEYLKQNDKGNKYDIGLVKLAQRVSYNDFVKPICLPENNSTWASYTVAGWGSSNLATQTKLKYTLHLYEKGSCQKQYSNEGLELGDDQICAQAYKGNCTSGLGGPLMRRISAGIYEVAGVSILSKACETIGWPGVFTSVATYKDWIIETLRITNV